ncbi:hypothetical protein CDL15_Pgr021084 [Punica granatum]|uniref:Uncharacterized protein n=1 Tax=Punica granatum TaxID=22663 RepID=A0A218WSB0_PUNGR|nr:hypothetical protein CDL15_Pgr021084 [Punica granatum]
MQWSGCETLTAVVAVSNLGCETRMQWKRLHFVGCRVCYWAIVLLLAKPQPYDEGFCFAGCSMLKDSSSKVERLRIPSGKKSESAVVLAMRYL